LHNCIVIRRADYTLISYNHKLRAGGPSPCSGDQSRSARRSKKPPNTCYEFEACGRYGVLLHRLTTATTDVWWCWQCPCLHRPFIYSTNLESPASYNDPDPAAITIVVALILRSQEPSGGVDLLDRPSAYPQAFQGICVVVNVVGVVPAP
jgi:hypothetical protein